MEKTPVGDTQVIVAEGAEALEEKEVPRRSLPAYVGVAAGLLMFAVALAIGYEILLRVFAGRGTTWVFDLSGYSLVWFTMFAATYTAANNSHVRVTILLERTTARTQRLVAVISYAAIAVYLAGFTFFVGRKTLEAFQRGEVAPTQIRFPVSVLAGILLIGTICFLVYTIILMTREWKELSRTHGNLSNKFLIGCGLAFAIGIILWFTVPEAGILIVLFTMLAFGIPVFAVLGIVGSIGLLYLQGVQIGLGQLSTLALKATDSNTLLAIPLFILSGVVLQRAGIGSDLFALAEALLRRVRGGVGAATIVACAFFASISGSSVAVAGTIGLIAIPAMLAAGYERRTAYGSVAGGGTLGILIPPSGAMIIYAGITGVSTGQLFIAGVIPGVMLIVMFAGWMMIDAQIQHRKAMRAGGGVEKSSLSASLPEEKISARQLLQLFARAWPGVALPLVVLGGIYTGFFTATESAAVALLMSVVVSALQGRFKLREVPDMLRAGTSSSGMIMMIVVGAIVLGGVITYLRIPNRLLSFIQESGVPTLAVMLVLVLLYLILGMFLDVVSVMLITLPVTFPLIEALGFNGLWFGVFVVILMELALITPPVGLNLFVIQDVAKADFIQVIRGALPYVIMLLLSALLVYIFPAIATWLPQLAYGY